MALTTPILFPVAAFDATQPMTFRFNVVGGDQVTGNRLIIKNNVTNDTVYDQTVTTYTYTHTVPANSLTNDIYYNATIQTINASGQSSTASSAIQFYCYETPVITITNMPVNNLIPNSSFEFQATYTQSEGELLNSYQYNLYDLSGTLIATSGTVYINSTNPPPTNFSYTFSGFDDGSSYYIEIVGQTINNTVITTGRINVIVKYENPNVFAIVSLENNMCDGFITITSNIVAIEGESNPSPPTYVDNNTMVDLTANGSYVEFTEGYEINGDFTIGIWGRGFKDYSSIMTIWSNASTDNQPYKMELNYNIAYKANDDTKYCFVELYVYSGTKTPLYIYSDYLPYPASSNDYFNIFIRRINNIYELVFEKTEGTT